MANNAVVRVLSEKQLRKQVEDVLRRARMSRMREKTRESLVVPHRHPAGGKILSLEVSAYVSRQTRKSHPGGRRFEPVQLHH